MRGIWLAVCGSVALWAGEDPKALVKRALEADLHAQEASRDYTFVQRDDVRMLDGSGKTKSHSLKTYDVTLMEGSPYKRLVARNDQPLSAEEQRDEDARLNYNSDQRKRESAAQKQQRIAEWERKRREQRDHLREIPDAFDFKFVGEETIEGRPAWVIEGTPHPGYKPKSSLASYFTKIKGRCWITKDSPHFAKLEFDTLDTIAIGAFVVRLKKGGHILVEQTRLSDDLWLPKHVTVKASARLFFVKGFNIDADYSFRDYKKFQADSHVVSSEPIK